MKIPNNYNGRIEYQKYVDVEERILKFNNVENIGKDESGNYNMYKITMGDTSKPPILITATVHGVEWHVASFSLGFFESIENNTYPDKNFRNKLLSDFHIVYLPVLNPWGMDNVDNIYAQFETSHYRNSTNTDINRDFVNKTQEETNNVISVMQSLKPFAHMDLHTYQPRYVLAQGKDLVVGNERRETEYLQHKIADELEKYTGRDVNRWGIQNNNGKVRDFTANLENDHTPVTLSILSEMVKPAYVSGNMEQRISDTDMYKFGNAFLHIFFEVAREYYEESNKEIKDNLVNKIVMKHKTVYFERDNDGIVKKITEEYDETCNNMIIETFFERDNDGNVLDIIRNKIN